MEIRIWHSIVAAMVVVAASVLAALTTATVLGLVVTAQVAAASRPLVGSVSAAAGTDP